MQQAQCRSLHGIIAIDKHKQQFAACEEFFVSVGVVKTEFHLVNIHQS
jgi:hypothetical protein